MYPRNKFHSLRLPVESILRSSLKLLDITIAPDNLSFAIQGIHQTRASGAGIDFPELSRAIIALFNLLPEAHIRPISCLAIATYGEIERMTTLPIFSCQKTNQKPPKKPGDFDSLFHQMCRYLPLIACDQAIAILEHMHFNLVARPGKFAREVRV